MAHAVGRLRRWSGAAAATVEPLRAPCRDGFIVLGDLSQDPDEWNNLYGMAAAKPGVHEAEVAAAVYEALVKRRCTTSFSPIVTVAPPSPVLAELLSLSPSLSLLLSPLVSSSAGSPEEQAGVEKERGSQDDPEASKPWWVISTF